MSSPLNIIFDDFDIYMISQLHDRVQLSIYSTRALFRKYFVAMEYKWKCFVLIFWAKVHL